jgi:DNA-binding NarL/FixJ family response regulator
MAADIVNVRVVLADDQDLVRAGFRVILESEPGISVVGEASDGAAAVDAVVALRPDVVCLDVQMPGVDGLEAARRIAALDDPPAVLVLTTFDNDDTLFAALDAGASSASPAATVSTASTSCSGEAFFSRKPLAPDVTRRVISRATTGQSARPARGTAPADTASGTAPAATSSVRSARPPAADEPEACVVPGLTERETEVLRLLGRGLSNAEIAGLLFVGDATVKTHVSNVLQKLQLRDRVQAVVWAYEHGVVRSRG